MNLTTIIKRSGGPCHNNYLVTYYRGTKRVNNALTVLDDWSAAKNIATPGIVTH
jgi:hypothetical protein